MAARTDAERLAGMALDKAKENWGSKGWARLSDAEREAYVAREALVIIMHWADHEGSPASELARAAFRLMQPTDA